MSDSDEYVYNSSDDDIEYSSDEGDGGNEVDDAVVEIENTFYDADDYRTSNPAKAAEMYEKGCSGIHPTQRQPCCPTLWPT